VRTIIRRSCNSGSACISSRRARSSRRAWCKAAGSVALLAGLLAAQPSAAQKIYPNEPLMMDPYSTIYVNDGSCSAGKVLRVQGAPRNQRRKKSCVPMSDLQSTLRPGAAR
jgi:hypothetical protein